MKNTHTERILGVLLLLLGVSCGTTSRNATTPAPKPPTKRPTPIHEVICMYGCPQMTYRISGRVTDATGKPVPGIEVSDQNHSVSVRTDAMGNYTIESTDLTYVHTALEVRDTDGTANGGEFAPQSVNPQLSPKNQTIKGKGSWNDGRYEKKGVHITVTPKTK